MTPEQGEIHWARVGLPALGPGCDRARNNVAGEPPGEASFK